MAKIWAKNNFFPQIYQNWHFLTRISVFGLFARIDRLGPGTAAPWFSHVVPLIYFTEFKFHPDITNSIFWLLESKQEIIALGRHNFPYVSSSHITHSSNTVQGDSCGLGWLLARLPVWSFMMIFNLGFSYITWRGSLSPLSFSSIRIRREKAHRKAKDAFTGNLW